MKVTILFALVLLRKYHHLYRVAQHNLARLADIHALAADNAQVQVFRVAVFVANSANHTISLKS